MEIVSFRRSFRQSTGVRNVLLDLILALALHHLIPMSGTGRSRFPVS